MATPTKLLFTGGAQFDDSSPLPTSSRFSQSPSRDCAESPPLSSSPPARVRSPRDSNARDSWTDEMNSIALGDDVDAAELEAYEVKAGNFENRREADASDENTESTDSTAMTPDDTSDEKDDAEDVMNMPHMMNSQNEFTPVNRLQGLNALIAREREPMSDEAELLMQRREALERELTVTMDEYERLAGENDESKTSGPTLNELQEHAGAVPIGPDVVVVDVDQLNRLLSVTNTATVTEDDSEENSRDLSELSSPAPAQVPYNTPDRFPKAPKYDTTPPAATMDQLDKVTPASISLPPSPAHAWNNENADPSTPTPSSVPLPTSQEKKDNFKDAIRSSGSRRISFADKPSNSEETPFTSTLKYFKSFKSHRRNASTPEELAELAREANDTSEPDETLDQYREKDLAPLDPVMGANVAGDLIMATTASSRAHNMSAIVDVQDFRDDAVGNNTVGDVAAEVEVRPIVWYALEVPGTYGEENKIRVGSSSPPEDVADFIRMKAEELEASQKEVDRAVAKFLDDPDVFVVGKDEEIEDMNSSKVEDPTFVKVVEMLPKAMFWIVVKVGALVADKAYETLAEQFGRLHT
ncbi:hypothetical protein BCR34DRAFT_604453 [Clohesyomyces aquaticus]|uniref:Uncharacterized protein n=1 Tax=Clohesyomyces aquaticus TaxID=1231657 RepID=A0A1Y1Z6F8_9PLEO|nr:hypothetical protein BCR34DRAFT_604453 [Clohesyomyces aquaticus]